MEDLLFWAPFLSGLVALAMVVYLVKDVLSKSEGNDFMKTISRQIQIGAAAFLKKEYTYVYGLVILIAIAFTVVGFAKDEWGINWQTAIAFVSGAVASTLAGITGMMIATRSNARTAEAARTGGVSKALSVAISGGSVMGLSVVGYGLIGLALMFLFFFNPDNVSHSVAIINGYAMGASLVALFARSGGGIYTKGADMGADLVGKVEAGLPEDDPRNPAVIADNVGDNVGDVAGLGADLCESFIESIIAAVAIVGIMTVGAASITTEDSLRFIGLPFLIAAAGVIASIVGIFYVKIAGSKNPQKALMMGTYIAGAITIIAAFAIVISMNFSFAEIREIGGLASVKDASESLAGLARFAPALAVVLGIVAGMGVGFISEYFTSSDYKPTKQLAYDSQTGPAINVTSGMAVGMASTAWPVIIIGVAIWASYYLAGGYGVAMAAFGMLATTGMVVAVDSYGPIADNAGGIAEMAGLPPEVRKVTDGLDAVGNTTAAIGKGFAIGSAAFASFGLLLAYMATIGLHETGINLLSSEVLVGLLIGGMIPFLFSAWLFRAVGAAAFSMIEEVRRQFKEIPGLREGKEGVLPDSARCVSISTEGAIKGMIKPGLLAILIPVIVGFISPTMLAGVLVGSLVTGVMLGIQTANSGGAMDNAKKYIEEGNYGGKNSEAHKAAVIGDTVGDPLKDTVGPSINILIKLMAVISLVLGPIFRAFHGL